MKKVFYLIVLSYHVTKNPGIPLMSALDFPVVYELENRFSIDLKNMLMVMPKKIWLFRITHIENIPHILRNGLVTRHSPAASEDFVRIGDISLIEVRDDIKAPVPPGGMLSEYIPFYFGPRSPMLYQISTGFDGVKQFPQQEIVYIVTSLDKIREHHLPYFFTDGHIRSFTSTSYNDDKYLEKLDWSAIFATYWKSDEADLRKQEKKQAELLVKNYVPVNAIELFCVYNEHAKGILYSFLSGMNHEFEVRISPKKLYYDHL